MGGGMPPRAGQKARTQIPRGHSASETRTIDSFHLDACWRSDRVEDRDEDACWRSDRAEDREEDVPWRSGRVGDRDEEEARLEISTCLRGSFISFPSQAHGAKRFADLST